MRKREMKELSALRRTRCPVKSGIGVRNRRNKHLVLTPVTNVTTKRNILIPPFCIVNLLRDSKGGVFS